MAEKIYVGSGKKVGQYGNISFSICLEDMQPYFTEGKNGKHYFNGILSEMKTKNQWGKTHSIVVDDWKPDPNYQKSSPSNQDGASQEVNFPSSDSDDEQIRAEDIPF